MLSMSPQDIARAVEVLRSGGVLAYPTEAVWGLGCDPWHRAGVQRILDLKGRDPDKGLIMVAADAEQLAPWLTSLPADQRARVYGSSPRPTTRSEEHTSELQSRGHLGSRLRLEKKKIRRCK